MTLAALQIPWIGSTAGPTTSTPNRQQRLWTDHQGLYVVESDGGQQYAGFDMRLRTSCPSLGLYPLTTLGRAGYLGSDRPAQQAHLNGGNPYAVRLYTDGDQGARLEIPRTPRRVVALETVGARYALANGISTLIFHQPLSATELELNYQKLVHIQAAIILLLQRHFGVSLDEFESVFGSTWNVDTYLRFNHPSYHAPHKNPLYTALERACDSGWSWQDITTYQERWLQKIERAESDNSDYPHPGPYQVFDDLLTADGDLLEVMKRHELTPFDLYYQLGIAFIDWQHSGRRFGLDGLSSTQYGPALSQGVRFTAGADKPDVTEFVLALGDLRDSFVVSADPQEETSLALAYGPYILNRLRELGLNWSEIEDFFADLIEKIIVPNGCHPMESLADYLWGLEERPDSATVLLAEFLEEVTGTAHAAA